MPKDQPPPGLPMRELIKKSGLPKSTILHYLDQGLLPPPVKTSPNMAYYDPKCLEILATVRDLQDRYNLPLSKIKKVLAMNQDGQSVEAVLMVSQEVFGPRPGELMGLEQFCEASGLTPELVGELQDAGLLLPMQEGAYDAQDLAIGTILAQGRKNGLTVDDIGYYHELGSAMVEREMALREKVMAGLPPAQRGQVTLNMVRAARAMRGYVIDRLFQHRVARAQGIKDPPPVRLQEKKS